MSNLKPGVPAVMTCSGAHDGCDASGAGHAISAIRERAALATPSKWRDAFVAHVDADGWIAIDLFDAAPEEDPRLWAWHHGDLTARLSVGQPVALHGVYDVLSLAGERISVLVTASA